MASSSFLFVMLAIRARAVCPTRGSMRRANRRTRFSAERKFQVFLGLQIVPTVSFEQSALIVLTNSRTRHTYGSFQTGTGRTQGGAVG